MKNIDIRKILIQILALLGLGLTIKLAFIYYTANYDQYALSSFCSINDFIDCDGAAKSTKSQFLGIPLAYWGIFFYIIVLFLTIVDRLKNIKFLKFLEVFKNPNSYIIALGSIAFIFSMGLAIMSLFIIKKLCILCVVTYFIDLIIALIASNNSIKAIIKSFKTTVLDFIDGAKQYTKTFITLLIITVCFLTYSGVTLNFVPHIKQKNSILKYRKIKFNPYRTKGNTLGDSNAEVVIELYSDFVCPLCYINNIMLHQAAKELKNIKIVHYNYPFDKECNPTMETNFHPYACFMSKGALAAKKQGNYWEMSSLLYENRPKKTEDMLKLAETLNFDINKFSEDLTSKETQTTLKKELQRGIDLELDATPTMIINGEKVVGVKPYYELKEILIRHGARKR